MISPREKVRFERILDYVSGQNGPGTMEIARALSLTPAAVSLDLKRLDSLGCVSKGATKRLRKDGSEGTLKTGWFYEGDLYTEVKKD